jgi:2-oxoglutarate ferredoxin oxidoreductase subunit beta
VLSLHKLAEHYDPSDRVGALAFLQERMARGEIATGLLFVDPEAGDLHGHLNTVAAPLNSLGANELSPGAGVLAKINAGLR